MMRISTLWSVVRSLDDGWISPIGTEIGRAWSMSEPPRYLRGSANFVFIDRSGGDRRFLRFAHESERNRAAIEQEMALLRWLDGQGLRVNLPVETASGESVATVETDLGRFHAVLLTSVAGEHLEIDTLDLPGFERWGEAVGQLHQALDAIPDHLGRPPEWPATIAAGQAAGGVIALEAEAIAADLTALPTGRDWFGPMHSDVELDNLLWNGEAFGFIDFDEYATGWRGVEIAKALSELESDLADGDPRRDAFIAGYRRRHELADEIVVCLPLMQRLFDLGMYLRLRRALAEPIEPAGAAKLDRLIANLGRWMAEYEDRTARALGVPAT